MFHAFFLKFILNYPITYKNGTNYSQKALPAYQAAALFNEGKDTVNYSPKPNENYRYFR
jgi:hypothetical protein